jgi:hypothetical protein
VAVKQLGETWQVTLRFFEWFCHFSVSGSNKSDHDERKQNHEQMTRFSRKYVGAMTGFVAACFGTVAIVL